MSFLQNSGIPHFINCRRTRTRTPTRTRFFLILIVRNHNTLLVAASSCEPTWPRSDQEITCLADIVPREWLGRRPEHRELPHFQVLIHRQSEETFFLSGPGLLPLPSAIFNGIDCDARKS